MNQDGSEISDTPLSVAALLRKIEAGWSPKYLCFWGHRPKRGEAHGKHVLSQWWESAFEAGGVCYPTAEHYMMAEKARLFGDDATLSRILKAASPGAAKELGRWVTNFAEWGMGGTPFRYRGPRQSGEVRPERRLADLSAEHGRAGAG